MKNLLKFEFRKLFKSKIVLVCAIIAVVLAIWPVVLEKILYFAFPGNHTPDEMMTAAETVLQTLPNTSFFIVVACFMAAFISDDRVNATIKNIYAKGYNKVLVYLSKMIVACSYVLALAFVCCLISFLMALALFPNVNGVNFAELKGLPAQFLILLAYCCFFGLIASFAKKTGGAVTGCILAFIFMPMLFMMLDAIRSIIPLNINLYFGGYWLDVMLTDICFTFTPMKQIVTALIGGGVYTVLFLGLGVVKNLKSEA